MCSFMPTSLGNILMVKFVSVVGRGLILLSRCCGIPLCDCIRPITDRHLGICQLTVVMNGTVKDILVHVFWCTIIYFSVGPSEFCNC